MAWYQEYRTNAAGQLKAFLDYIITNYGQEGGYGWSIVDTGAGTNIGVYKCRPDDSSSFVLVVKDNQVDYATIEYWGGWDAVDHVGVGNSMTYGKGSSHTLRIRKVAGTYGAAINKQRIALAIIGGGFGYYLGYPKRFDETKDTPLFIGHSSYTSASDYNHNPLNSTNASLYWNPPGTEWRWFKNTNGNINQTAANFGATIANQYPRMDTGTPNGKYIIFETLVQEHDSPYLCIGLLDGVMCKSNCPSGLSNGQTITVGSDVWLMVTITANYTTCLIKEA